MMHTAPVGFDGGHFYVESSAGERTLIASRNSAPLPLLAGWTPVEIRSDDGIPINFLTLRHENGREAIWFLDSKMTYIANDLAQLPTHLQEAAGRQLLGELSATDKPASAAPHVEDIAIESTNSEEPLGQLRSRHNGSNFLNPSTLSVTPLPIRRIALIGSCFLEHWGFHRDNPSGCIADLVVMNNAGALPELSEMENGDRQAYDLQIIQIPLRHVLGDASLWSLPYASTEQHTRAFGRACETLAFLLESRMQWNLQRGMLTFVTNFFLPQRNIMGCLFPRFDIRNPEYFVEKLNEHLEILIRQYKNTYILDVDRISASFGRRFIQDDIIEATGHNSLFPIAGGAIANRIEPTQEFTAYFDITWPAHFREALWSEIITMYRTVRQIDTVKLVVMDLDDTLWKGVSGDIASVDSLMVEGWPLGLAEALSYLKKRGILLAIVSKNDEQRIRAIWSNIFLGRLNLEDFAAIRINWKSKAENLAEILAGLKLLPRNVVFVDDNPVERAAIRTNFPDVRLLGRHPYYLRQTLLWSSETQVTCVTPESSLRTEMIKSQLQREDHRAVLSRDAFLKEAAPIVTLILITTVDHPRFPRALELINKTNQFNTLGRRWTFEECDAFVRAGGVLYAYEVTDKYTGYGLVGVVITKDGEILQWVMSCRVLGYQIEEAVMATIVPALRGGGAVDIRGHVVETEVNFPCRDLFGKCGFTRSGESWVLSGTTNVAMPAHVKIIEPASAA